MVLQVHDELVFDVPNDELGSVATIVQEAMERALDLGVPIEVELKEGPNWYEMSPLERAVA
jgi:DNA polymerase-1